jgi:hypothetical protein
MNWHIEVLPVSFLESRYPSLRPPVECPEFGCTIAALQDLAAFKLLAITG